MAIDRIYVGVGPGETRVALCDGDRLVDLIVERDGEAGRSGDIYRGRVTQLAVGLGAAFIDLGLDRPGFLPLGRTTLSEGDAVSVQIVQEAVGEKGVKLTRELTLTGRYMIYAPGQDRIWLSKRIEGNVERARLIGILKERVEPGEGIVVRTAAVGIDPARLHRELDGLRRQWHDLEARRSAVRTPACLLPALDAARAALRDDITGSLVRLMADDADRLASLRAFCAETVPEFGAVLELHAETGDLFETAGIEVLIEAALDPCVVLPSGGEIVIESTAALTAIDVNAAQATGLGGAKGRKHLALAVNLEAVAAIAQQLRLRNIAGVILCDMLPMPDRRQGAQVLAAFEAAAADDRVPVRVAGFTRLGLVELVRDRHRAPLAERLLLPTAGRPVRAPLAVAFAALRAVLVAVRREPGLPPRLVVAPPVAQSLTGPAATARARAEAVVGAAIAVDVDAALGLDGFRLEGQRR